MTYSLDFRKQVLKILEHEITYVQAAELYNLSPATIQNWTRRVHSKVTKQTKPHKIIDNVLLSILSQLLQRL